MRNQEEDKDPGTGTTGGWRANWRQLWRLFREQVPEVRGEMVAAVLLLAVATLLGLVFVFVAALLADRAAGTPGGGVVGWAVRHDSGELSVFLLLVALLIAASGYFAMTWLAEIGAKATAELRRKLFASLMTLPLGFYAGASTGEISRAVISDAGKLQSAWMGDFRRLVQYLLLLLAGLVTVFILVPPLAAVSIAAMAAVAVVTWWLLKRPQPRPTTPGAAEASLIGELVHGLAVVKAFGNENYERGRLRRQIDGWLSFSVRSLRMRSMVLAVAGLALLALLVLLMRQAAIAIDEGRFEAGIATAFITLLVWVVAAAWRLGGAITRLNTGAEAASRLSLLLKEESEALETGDYLPGSRERLKGKLKVSRVSFAFPASTSGDVLEDISFLAAPGKRIAIVGPAGSGKSALTCLLLGLYPPRSGEILIDGRPISDYPLSWLRGQIGAVPQQAEIFSGSIEYNIAYGRPAALPVEIREAAEKAHALEFIEALPQGMKTKLWGAGELELAESDAASGDAEKLSASELRRIALARVFLEDPPLVVIDSPSPMPVVEGGKAETAAVAVRDAEEALVEGRTAVIVAHRLSAARDADEILLLRGGKILERGRHDELYEDCGYYRLLCEGEFGKS